MSVVVLSDSTVAIDANHPPAVEDPILDLEVLDVSASRRKLPAPRVRGMCSVRKDRCRAAGIVPTETAKASSFYRSPVRNLPSRGWYLSVISKDRTTALALPRMDSRGTKPKYRESRLTSRLSPRTK